jgi:hypothetical protein
MERLEKNKNILRIAVSPSEILNEHLPPPNKKNLKLRLHNNLDIKNVEGSDRGTF